MTPTPKKTTTSLSDRLKNKEEEQNEDVNTDAVAVDVDAVVVEKEKPVDNQAANPDGVTFSGNSNVINKTPSDMSSETATESANRYGISDEVPEDVHNNPNVVATNDNKNYQIPGGTHLHPDVARDNYNRSVGSRTESGEVTVSQTQLVFAKEAELDDKGIKNPPLDDLA